jgi:PAS domain S-box-containing protein
MNPVAEHLTGWSASEAVGRPLQEVFRTVDAETREESDDFVTKILQTGEVLDIAVDRLLLARDGQEYLVADSGAPILSQSGEMVGVVFVFRDVTAQRELETQLSQVQKIEAIGQLAGGIAHDFNNQLAGIVGFADVLVSSAKDEDTRMCAETILKTAQQAADLTRQLLAFARRGQYEKRPVDMHEAIRTATALLSRSVDRRIEIVTKLVAVEHTVRGDRSQLENAMLNLGLNACDAMREGGRLTYGTDVVHLDPEYCERVAFEVQPGRHLRVTISDTGQGMTPEVLGRIFEPFFTTKGPGEGTGMGLAAVYGAVTQHGGAIDVKSSPGRGTTFRIYLPLTSAAPERPGSYAPSDEVANVRDKHIMVVDDEATLRTLLGNMLKPLGHEVTTMENGEEAVAYYRENWERIDLVILDMVMPKMNGKQAFAAMQNVNPEVKVLITSGYSVDDDTEQLLQAGARGFMQKPFSVRELRATVNRILQS